MRGRERNEQSQSELSRRQWPQGLTTMAMVRSRLKGRDREISVRRQVGDAEGMINEGWTGGDDDEEL